MGYDHSRPAQPEEAKHPRRTWLVAVLAAASVVVFLYYLPPLPKMAAGNYQEWILYLMNLIHDGGYPGWMLFDPVNPTIPKMVYHQFAHAGLYHLVSNVAALVYAGRVVERKYGWIIVVVFLVGGMAGAVAHGLWDASLLLGSSGAVSAVLGSSIILYPGYGNKFKMVVTWFVVYNLIPMFFAFDNISYAAHIGGLVVGLLAGAIYWGIERWRQPRSGQHGR